MALQRSDQHRWPDYTYLVATRKTAAPGDVGRQPRGLRWEPRALDALEQLAEHMPAAARDALEAMEPMASTGFNYGRLTRKAVLWYLPTPEARPVLPRRWPHADRGRRRRRPPAPRAANSGPRPQGGYLLAGNAVASSVARAGAGGAEFAVGPRTTGSPPGEKGRAGSIMLPGSAGQLLRSAGKTARHPESWGRAPKGLHGDAPGSGRDSRSHPYQSLRL